MKIKANEDNFKVPPIGIFESAYIEDGSREDFTQTFCMRLVLIPLSRMLELKCNGPENVGIPMYISHISSENKMLIYPTPARHDLSIEINYFPPMERI